MPSMPSERAWSDGNAPIPMRVVVTGIRVSSASAWSSADASAAMTPPPTYRTARRARMMAFAAFLTWPGCPSNVGLYDRRWTRSGYSKSACFRSTSFGRSMCTGPGRPVAAMWNASRITGVMSLTSFTR